MKCVDGRGVSIRVISLVRADDRRRSIRQQFAKMGLNFEFFDAVDGKNKMGEFGRYKPAQVRKIGAKPLTWGQLGCFESHYLLWEECVQSGRPMIVVEDDAIFDADRFREFVEWSNSSVFPSAVQCLRLFENKASKPFYWQAFHQTHWAIGKFLRGHVSATGYYLTPDGAEKFLKYCQTWFEPVDRQMDHFWLNGVECYGMDPPCLTHDKRQVSFMPWGEDQKARRSFSQYFRWRAYNAALKIGRLIHNMRYRLRNSVGPLKTQSFEGLNSSSDYSGR